MIDLKNKTLLISAVQCNLDEDSFSILHEHTIKNGFNVEQLNHLFKDGFQGEFIEEKHGKLLDKYLKEAHEHGIAVIVYFCLHELFESDKQVHPEWLQKDRNGEFIGAYGSHYLACLNSPWREYSKLRIKQLCNHDIDGIFLDGPFFAVNGCFCDSCREKYKKTTGKDFLNADFSDFLRFRTDWLTEFVKELRECADEVKKGVPMYLNNSALRADVIGSNTRRLAPYVDLIGAEGGFSSAMIESVYLTGAMAKEIEVKAEGKPTVMFIAGDRKPYSFSLHTPEDTIRMMAQTVANGSNIWYGLHGPSTLMNSPSGKAARLFMADVAKNDKYIFGTRSTAKVALVWSVDTANYYSSKVMSSDFTGDRLTIGESEEKGDHYDEFLGWYEFLSREHISFDVVDDIAFIKNAGRYKTLILPAVACASDEFVSAIQKFAFNGGRVVASLIFAAYDELGKLRNGNLGEDLFGITFGKIKREWRGTVYQKFEGEQKLLINPPLFNEITNRSAKILAYKLKTMSGRYERPTDEERPSLTENLFGAGSGVFIANDVGADYHEIVCEDEYTVMARALSGGNISLIKTDAPCGVEITVRQKENLLIVHMINLTGDKNPMTFVPELRDIKLFSGNETIRIKRAFFADGTPLEKIDNGFLIKKLKEYALVILECE